MKNFKSKFLIILTVLCTILGFSTGTAAAANNGDLEVKTSVGFNNTYKVGFSTPVNITVKNKSKDINGEVEIRVPSTPGKYMSYVKPISLQKDAEKVITINVPVSMNRTKYTLYIYNGKDKVYEDIITIGMTSNNATSFIGILSDDFDSLSYINEVPASSGMSLLTKVIKLDDKNFPEDIFTLNAFDVLVINDFDTSRFSKTQYEILKQWVGNGGTLLIGTGSKYNKTLSIFKDNFIEGTQGSVKEISTSKIYELATNGDNKNSTRVDALSMNIKDSTAVMEDKDVKLVQVLTKGKGVVGIAAFDLGKAPFVNWKNNTAFAKKLLEIINPEMAAYKNNINYYRNDSYMLREAMNKFSEMAAAKTSSFYLILFIYVIVVAPLSYFVLKKIDKREFMWITVPAFAVIFGLIVFISGSGTRLSEITTNVISFLNIDEKGNTSASTYAGIFNSNKMKVKIEGKNGERVIPLSNDNYYNSNQPVDNEVMEAKIFDTENGGVEYRNSSLLETKVLQVQENSRNIGKVEADINLKNGAMMGYIKNSTNLNLVDCLIVMPDGYYKIDSLKSGESVKLDGKVTVSYSGNIQQMIQDVFFSSNINNSNITGDSRKKYMDKNQEGSILQMMFNSGNEQIDGIKFIAFSKTQIHNPLIINGSEVKKNERNILCMPLKLKFTDGNAIEYPLGFVPFEISTSNLGYDIINRRFAGNGSAELLYKIDKDMKVDEIGINTANWQLKASVISQNYSIFNIEKNSYEPVGDQVIKGDNIKKYLSQDNIVKIKLELRDADAAVLQMAAKGRKK